jgi:hypothetical protein
MKHMKKHMKWMALVFVIALSGCSKMASKMDGGIAAADDRVAAQFEAGPDSEFGISGANGEAGNVSADSMTPAGRKLVYSAAISIRVGAFEDAEKRVGELLAHYHAYSSRTRADETSRDWTIRVPVASYRDALADIAGIGRVISRSETADDVTLRFYDLEGRLNTKRELLKTFQSYLTKAAAIEEILSVEEHIADLEDEIDRLGGEFALLNNQIDYATIRVTVRNTAPPVRDTLGEQFRELFGSFGAFLRGIIVALTGIVVYGIPVVIICAALFWLLLGKIGLLRRLWHFIAGKSKR